jgi:hypothetical protein
MSINAAGEYEGVRVFGGGSAFKFEMIQNAKNIPVISVDGALKSGRSYDWEQKVTVQITPDEQPALLCFLLGITPGFQVEYHGPARDKSLQMVNQLDRGSLYCKMWKKGVPIGIEMSAVDSFKLGALALKVLSLQTKMDVPTCLAVLRGTAGRLLSQKAN